MKYPKHRASIYLVVRENKALILSAVGAFRTFDEAMNYKDACAQEMRDKGVPEGTFSWTVTATTYYDV
jgi:hypothetical protein